MLITTMLGTFVSRSSRIRHCAVALALVGAPLAVCANKFAVTAGEFALLPPYCYDTQGFKYGDASYNPSPRAPYWVSLMGKSFWHMHHHCYGLVKMRRGLLTVGNPGTRKYLLQSAVDEFNYVIEQSDPDFVMLPEVFLRRGDAQLELQDVGGAMESYGIARRLKPDFALPYVHWAKELARLGRTKEALAHLEDGMRVAPNDPKLQASYKGLGRDPAAFLKTLPPRPVVADAKPANPEPAPAAATDNAAPAPEAAASR